MSSTSFPESTHLFDADGNTSSPFIDSEYTPPPYNNFADSDSLRDSFLDSPAFGSNGTPSDNGVFVGSDGPILPPPSDMSEEGFALREWRRQNAAVLEEKEKREKEILSQIIEEANEYKVAFHVKRKTSCESNKTNNREKEKLFLASHENFHKEANKNYWKAIVELVPNEVPVIKKRGKKEEQKKPSVVVIQGPKPGKPTDRVRMRQILVKLKHNTPDHLKLAPSAETVTVKDDASSKTQAIAATPEAVVAA